MPLSCEGSKVAILMVGSFSRKKGMIDGNKKPAMGMVSTHVDNYTCVDDCSFAITFNYLGLISLLDLFKQM